jgi:hypothetical protein
MLLCEHVKYGHDTYLKQIFRRIFKVVNCTIVLIKGNKWRKEITRDSGEKGKHKY